MILTAYCVSVREGREQGPELSTGYTAELVTANYGDPNFKITVEVQTSLGAAVPFATGSTYAVEIGEPS